MKLLSKFAAAVAALTLVTSAFAVSPKAYIGNFKDNTVSVIDSKGCSSTSTTRSRSSIATAETPPAATAR